VKTLDAPTVERLLNEGANANAQDESGQHAISLAAEAPITCTINGMSTSGYCHTIEKHRGYEEIVSALVEHGARVNVKNHQGWSPLQQAMSFEEAKAVALLKKAGARE